MSLFNAGIGDYTRTPGRNTYGTLLQLEADLRRLRAMGAPDDAHVLGAAPGSIRVAEVQWIAPDA